MKVLFSKQGKHIYCADEEKRIFCIDDVFYDENGNIVTVEKPHFPDDEEGDNWYQYWMDYEGLEEPLKSESTVEPEWDIDDCFGKFGFKDKTGKFVIKPQYAFANEFTCGLACVNLNRTWYKSDDGIEYYENHYGYIDKNGKTVIGFQYDDAYPFNKYGVALVSDLKEGWHLIDTKGEEIPGTRFGYISMYDYNNRFLEFSYNAEAGYDNDAIVGVYDTKKRKILIEPSVDTVIEWDDDCLLVYACGEYGAGDFRQHYINSKGDILYPWLYNKGFSIVRMPDSNNISAVAVNEFTEFNGKSNGYFEHNGKKYTRKFIYGLYSSKEDFILPLQYDEIKKMCNNIWGCVKDGAVTVLETESTD